MAGVQDKMKESGVDMSALLKGKESKDASMKDVGNEVKDEQK